MKNEMHHFIVQYTLTLQVFLPCRGALALCFLTFLFSCLPPPLWGRRGSRRGLVRIRVPPCLVLGALRLLAFSTVSPLWLLRSELHATSALSLTTTSFFPETAGTPPR